MKNENKEIATEKELYKASGYKNKIIFATNVAESSITFDGLINVIDTGLELSNSFDPLYNMNVIKKDYITQAQIIQRIGRSGRTCPGIAYHLYTKQLYDSLYKYPKPSILVIDIKRFNATNRKNQIMVDFPLENLNLSKYVIGYNKDSYVYDLYAVCNHSGSVLGGHYTSFVKNANGKWYHYNDTSVSEVALDKQIISPKAYCFFYRKRQTK